MIGGRKFRTHKARKRARVRLFASIAGACLVFVILLSGVLYALRTPSLRMQHIVISGAHMVDEDTVRSLVVEELAGFWLSLIPRDTVLSLRTARIEDRLMREVLRIKEARVSRAGFTSLAVQVIERHPRALWCGDVVPPIAYVQTAKESEEVYREELWGTCYLMDDESFIYAPAPAYTGDTYVRYYGPLAKGEPLGQALLPRDTFAGLQAIVAALGEADLTVRALLLVDEQDMELYLDNRLRILVERTVDPADLAVRLSAVLAAPSTKEAAKIEYVDMRFGNKAYLNYYDEPASE